MSKNCLGLIHIIAQGDVMAHGRQTSSTLRGPKMRRYLLVLTFALLAAACTSEVRLTQQEISPSYRPGEFAYAGADRDMRVIVVGNPFGGEQEAFEWAVTIKMQGNHWGPRTNFTATPDASARNSYRIVMLFDPPVDMAPARLCRDDPSTLPSINNPDTTTLFAAFCRERRSLTEIKGSVPRPSGPEDPVFGDLVAEVTNGLFPPDRSHDDSRGDCRLWLHCD